MPEQSNLQKIISGVVTGGLAAGTASAFSGRSQDAFADNYIRVSEENERRREQQRQQNEAFVRQLVVNNPSAFASLPQEFQQAFAEPIAEQANISGEEAIPVAQQLLTQPPQQVSPGVALQGAQLGANIGDQDLMNSFLQMIDPTLGGQIPQEELLQDPIKMARLAEMAEAFTPDSYQRFYESVIAERPDFTQLELRPPSESESLGDFTNVMAHRGLAAMEAGEELTPEMMVAMQKKLGITDSRISPTSAFTAMMNSMGTGILITAAEMDGGLTLDNLKAVMVPAMQAALDASEAMGLSNPSGEFVGNLVRERLQWRSRLNNPALKDAAINEIREDLRRQSPADISEDTLDMLVAERVDLIRQNAGQ